MAQANEIKAMARPSSGKGAARAVRRSGQVPAVIYGGDQGTPETIALDANALLKTIRRGRFLSTVFEIDVAGRKIKAIPRDVQLDPVRDVPLHVDFQRIGSDNRVRVGVPVRFLNEGASPGLKRGGVLNIVRHEVEVWCPADRIPQHFEVDLTGLEIGRSIHISAVKLPEGVRPTITSRDFTIATIAGAGGQRSEEEAAAQAAAVPAAAAAATMAAAPAAGAKAAAPAAGAGKAAAPAAGGKAPAAAPAPKAAAPAKGKK